MVKSINTYSSSKKDFLKNEIWILAWAGASQRANIFPKDMDEKSRNARLNKGEHSNIVTIESEIVKIDDLNYKKVSFIKVDVEGAELMVLKGAIKTIKKSRPVVMIEIEDRWIESYDIKRKDIGNFFSDLNYQTHYYFNKNLIKCDINYTKSNNLIFIPHEHKIIE